MTMAGCAVCFIGQSCHRDVNLEGMQLSSRSHYLHEPEITSTLLAYSITDAAACKIIQGMKYHLLFQTVLPCKVALGIHPIWGKPGEVLPFSHLSDG